MNYETNKKSFFEELQSLSEPMKQRILVVSTIVIMILVVYVWLGYFNGIVVSGSQSGQGQVDAQTTAQQTEPSSPGVSFWQKMESGAATIIDNFKQPGQYNVQPQ